MMINKTGKNLIGVVVPNRGIITTKCHNKLVICKKKKEKQDVSTMNLFYPVNDCFIVYQNIITLRGSFIRTFP